MTNILITGANRGIGGAIARIFADEGGNQLFLGHKSYDDNYQAMYSYCSKHNKAITMLLNVTDRAWLESLAKNLNAREDPLEIDYLINNAGTLADRTVRKMSNEEWDKVIATNLTGVFNVTKTFLPYMRKGGCIVNITSIKALTGGFGQSNYAASKAGVIAFTKSLAKEEAKNDIRVNALVCGYVDTDMTKTIPKQYMDEILKSIPMHRMATEKEIAKCVKFICNDATYMTGNIMIVDGGLT